MKLALGTVQFGLPYGATNKQGQVGAGEIERITAERRPDLRDRTGQRDRTNLK